MANKGQIIGYIRVSSVGQNTARQEDELRSCNPDRVFVDRVSGKDVLRPQLQEAMSYLRSGDTLIVHSMDRLARNLDDLRNIVKQLTMKGVKVQFLKESLTFTGDDSPMSTLLLSVMGAFAEFERSLIRERQREGIELAKLRGAFKGRKPSLDESKKREIRDKLLTNMSKTEVAKAMGISRETLYKFLRENSQAGSAK